MGLIAAVIAFARRTDHSETTVDPGGGSNITADHFANPGDDSYPLDTDFAAVVSNGRTGGGAAVGYADPITTKKAGPGEKRIYARDAAGAVVCEIWLQSDGTIVVQNDNGGMELAPNGSVNINGVIIDAAGDITAPGSLVLNGNELDGHLHLAGTPPGDTGPNK